MFDLLLAKMSPFQEKEQSSYVLSEICDMTFLGSFLWDETVDFYNILFPPKNTQNVGVFFFLFCWALIMYSQKMKIFNDEVAVYFWTASVSFTMQTKFLSTPLSNLNLFKMPIFWVGVSFRLFSIAHKYLNYSRYNLLSKKPKICNYCIKEPWGSHVCLIFK